MQLNKQQLGWLRQLVAHGIQQEQLLGKLDEEAWPDDYDPNDLPLLQYMAQQLDQAEPGLPVKSLQRKALGLALYYVSGLEEAAGPLPKAQEAFYVAVSQYNKPGLR